jgi:Family of unknown function (DUF5309)
VAAVSGMLTTFNSPNYVGELFNLTPNETPFLAMIGGLSGGESVASKRFTWQTTDNAAASQPAVLEGADYVYSGRDRAEVFNVVQIFQEAVQVSYTRQATTGQLGNLPSGSPAASSILGTQPVMNEMGQQIRLKREKIARDAEYTFLQGTFAEPNDNATARRTRGLIPAITTNVVAAGATALSKAQIDTLLRTMFNNGAPLSRPVILLNAFQKQAFSNIYGYAPESRNVGGVNITSVETDFGILGIQVDRHMPTDTVLIAELSVIAPVFLLIPGKGFLFLDQIAEVGSYDREGIYGEMGLRYGPESWSGKITGLTTS